MSLRLPNGSHTLTARSKLGAASIHKPFRVTGKQRIGIAYSYETGQCGSTPSLRHFDVTVSDKEFEPQ